MVPPISDMASPWNIGSNRITKAPITTVPAVSRIGVVRTAPASITACFKGIPSATRRFTKSISNTEFRTIIPARAIIPINDVAVKKAPNIQCPRTIPTRDKGMATIITIGALKFWNHPTINI